jgi:hypothetical protein
LIDANASSIENAVMLFALIAVIAPPALALLYLFKVSIHRRRRQGPAQSLLDVIGRK